MVATPPSSAFRLSNFFKDHPDAVAALGCGALVLLGWQMLNFGWLGIALFVLTAAWLM
jgi:Cd2+/Zn2+-exporting ATPase